MNQIAAIGAPSAGTMLIFSSFGLLSLGYFYLFWDRRRDDSLNREDGQVGLKLVLYTLLLISLGLAAGAIESILGYLLSGAKNAQGAKGSGPIKWGIASLVAGGAGVAAVFFVFLPRTNAKEYPQAERFAWGIASLVAGVSTVLGLNATLQGFFGRLPGWPLKAHALASLLVAGGLAFWAIMRFGAMSGWQVSVSPQLPGQQPQAGGYQPQAGGYQPQAGGYQPQAGGYQPQAGGYQQPQGGGYQQPQGGGYQQPQGGGYQQPQGGGLPSPGGGYPPQGGGGFPGR
ncbi:hypothetical protein [Haliangium sp.]|uniref:hypothetical protein n=1 Tax=Haliangium sp. TaxID=2663208 RepID=UPI003D103161